MHKNQTKKWNTTEFDPNCLRTKFELELKLFWISESTTKILINLEL